MLYTKDGSNAIIEQNIIETDGSMICSKRADTNYYWHRQDIRGSVTNIVDIDDDVVKCYTYDAYGNTTATGTFINSTAYTGAVIDEETGLYYMNARYYEPETGRFISQDTYRGDGESFWHLYTYCDGDPVNNTDPTGHITFPQGAELIKKWIVWNRGPKSKHINALFAIRLAQLADYMQKKIYIGYGYRSYAEQRELYYHGASAIYENGVFKGNPRAAKPGKSWHEYSCAVDVKATDWLCKLEQHEATINQTTLTKFGLYKPLTKGNGTKSASRENWHIQPIEIFNQGVQKGNIEAMKSFAHVFNGKFGYYK